MATLPALADHLAVFKAGEGSRAHLVVGLADSADLRRVAAAWSSPTNRVGWALPDEDEPKDLADRWNWIWSGVSYDPRALATSAMVGRARVGILMDSLRDNMVIYPDGTISEVARGILQQGIAQAMGVKAKRN